MKPRIHFSFHSLPVRAEILKKVPVKFFWPGPLIRRPTQRYLTKFLFTHTQVQKSFDRCFEPSTGSGRYNHRQYSTAPHVLVVLQTSCQASAIFRCKFLIFSFAFHVVFSFSVLVSTVAVWSGSLIKREQFLFLRALCSLFKVWVIFCETPPKSKRNSEHIDIKDLSLRSDIDWSIPSQNRSNFFFLYLC